MLAQKIISQPSRLDTFDGSAQKGARNVNFKNLIRQNVAHLRQFVIQLARNIRPRHSS